MIEALRVLTACRKTAVAARRVALQMIHNTIVCAPDGLRETLRRMTRRQLVRTLAAWRPDLTAYRDVEAACRIGLKSLARRYLELHDEIADLDVMVGAIVNEPAWAPVMQPSGKRRSGRTGSLARNRFDNDPARCGAMPEKAMPRQVEVSCADRRQRTKARR